MALNICMDYEQVMLQLWCIWHKHPLQELTSEWAQTGLLLTAPRTQGLQKHR